MKLGYIGLGKMGFNMVERLLQKGHDVVVFGRNEKVVKDIKKRGADPASSIQVLISVLPLPRIIWLMIPYQAVEGVLKELVPYLDEGDTIIDGGNSFFKDSMRRARELEEKNVHFLDVGVSGGPGGARNGACIMVGGEKAVYKKFKELFRDLSARKGYAYMGKSGAGHFVKMVHNGIEYGMMQAIAEGFAIMKASPFDLDLMNVAEIYNHRSVIESRLVGWLKNAFDEYGQDLEDVSGSVAHTGEGAWTVETAKELEIPAPIIEGALNFRIESQKNPSYAGRILSALRNQFGGHEVIGK